MFGRNLRFQRIIIACLSGLIFILAIQPIRAIGTWELRAPSIRAATVKSGVTQLRQPRRFVMPSVGAPGNRSDAATRQDCSVPGKYLTALVPPKDINFTRAAHPTLWFYVPFSPSQNRSVELRLNDEAGNLFYTTQFPWNSKPGIIGIRLPESKTLEEGKRYRWIFSYICNPSSREEDDFRVSGSIERVLANSPYIATGLWYETLTELAQLQIQEPENSTVAAEWRTLLEQVELPQLISEPVLKEIN